SLPLRVLLGHGFAFPLALVGMALGWRRWRELLPWVPAAASLFAGIVVTLPLSRYRAPLVVLLLPLAGLTLATVVTATRERRWRSVAGIVLAVAALGATSVALERHVVFAEHDIDAFRYRMPEQVLGARFHAQRGDLATAAGELLAVVDHH